MLILWKKIEFCKEESDHEAILIAAGGLGLEWGGVASLRMGFKCLKARPTSRRQFPFSTKFPGIPGTHFTNLGKMKG